MKQHMWTLKSSLSDFDSVWIPFQILFDTVSLSSPLKCPRKTNFNTQCPTHELSSNLSICVLSWWQVSIISRYEMVAIFVRRFRLLVDDAAAIWSTRATMTTWTLNVWIELSLLQCRCEGIKAKKAFNLQGCNSDELKINQIFRYLECCRDVNSSFLVFFSSYLDF